MPDALTPVYPSIWFILFAHFVHAFSFLVLLSAIGGFLYLLFRPGGRNQDHDLP